MKSIDRIALVASFNEFKNRFQTKNVIHRFNDFLLFKPIYRIKYSIC